MQAVFLNLEHLRMIHFVLHDAKDTVAVVVVEDVKSGMPLTGWIMDEEIGRAHV